MNERIHQLVEQANDHISYRICELTFKEIDDPTGPYVRTEFNKEKFAELIVNECISQIEIEKGNPYRNMGDENRYGIGACVESIRRIKQHFGVEE